MRKKFEAFRQLTTSTKIPRDQKFVMRLVIGGLLLLNLVALWMLISPPGGSAEELEERLMTLRSQLNQKKAVLKQTRGHAEKISLSQTEIQKFESEYFTNRRFASSTFVAELGKAAKDAGIRQKENLFLFDEVEGSEDLSMMTITASYEGTYPDLLHFINNLDRSPRFLILDTLTATPQQGSGILNVTVKLNAFVQEEQQP